MDLTEAEDIQRRWQEYTEELYRKDPHDPDNHNGVYTYLEPDILEWEVKWARGSITMNKASEMMEFQLSYFKSYKMMLWKCCTQYASKFGKLSSSHRTGKGQFSFQSQRKATPNNAQTITQLHSSHMLVKWCLKFSKPGFSNMWTVNFQIFKLVLEKAEEWDINLPTSTRSLKKQESSRKTSFCFIAYVKTFDCVDHNKLGKILKEMGIPDHLTCLLRNLYASQEATVRTRHGTTDWFQIGKGVHQSCILSPCLFNLYAEYIMRNVRLDEAQAGIKIAGRNINGLRYADDTTLLAESEELKSLLMRVKDESKKNGLKFSIHKTKIMASVPITSWKIDGETVETDADFFCWGLVWGSKIIVNVDCSHEIKRCLSLEGKLWPTYWSAY